MIRVYEEAGNVIETTRRLLPSPLRGNRLAFRGRECQNDRALVSAMCAHAAFDFAAVAIIYWNLETTVAHLVFE